MKKAVLNARAAAIQNVRVLIYIGKPVSPFVRKFDKRAKR